MSRKEIDSTCYNWTGDIFREDARSRTVNTEIVRGNKIPYAINKICTVSNLELPTQHIDLTDLTNRFPKLKSFEMTPNAREVVENDVKNNGPLLTKTKLGWAIHGPINYGPS